MRKFGLIGLCFASQLILFVGCGANANKPISVKRLSQKVKQAGSLYYNLQPAGSTFEWRLQDDHFDMVDSFGLLNAPTNTGYYCTWEEGTMATHAALYLGEKMEAFQTDKAKVLGACAYSKDGVDYQMLICCRQASDLRFDDLFSIHDPVRASIQNWLQYRYGIGRVSNLRWQDRSDLNMED